MAQRRATLMDPPIEELLDKVDSKFTLVALASKRARQINAYYNQLGESMGVIVPPQVTSVSGKPLTIAFEEVAGGKAAYHTLQPGEEGYLGDEEPPAALETAEPAAGEVVEAAMAVETADGLADPEAAE